MRSRFTIMMITLSVSILLLGCYPEGPEYTDDLDIVLTNYEPSYDFKSRGTYARPDKIVRITGNLLEGDDPVFLPDAIAGAILSQIDKNMSALGWTKVDVSKDPDILLTPASWETTTIYYYYDYWYWWYGGYYPPYGYYPAYASSYSTGTLLMRIIDPSITSGTGDPVSQWTGAVNGILTGALNTARIAKGVDQAFTQSPYLKTN